MAINEINHFVSVTYLNQWLIPGDSHFLSLVYKNESAKYKIRGRMSSGNAYVFERKLYWLDTNDEQKRYEIEKHFTEGERKLGIILEKLKTTIELSIEEKTFILDYIMDLRIRTPHLVNPLKSEEAKREAENQVKCLMFKQGYLADYPIVKELFGLKDEINNLPLSSIKMQFEPKQNFLRKFGKGCIFILDVSKSNYNLITSNYPVIYDILFSNGVLDLCFPLTPTKIFFVVSEESLNTARDVFTKMPTDYLVTRVNEKILNQHKNNKIKQYQVFANTIQLEKVLPKEKLSEFLLTELT
jgi:hypothetical protein